MFYSGLSSDNDPLIEGIIFQFLQIQQLDSPFLLSHGPFSWHDSSPSFPQLFLFGCILPLHLHYVGGKKGKPGWSDAAAEMLSELQRARL